MVSERASTAARVNAGSGWRLRLGLRPNSGPARGGRLATASQRVAKLPDPGDGIPGQAGLGAGPSSSRSA